MNELQIFQNEEFGQVRVVEKNGEPWFVGKDVTDVLQYQNGSRDLNRHVDAEDKTSIEIFDGNQKRRVIVINESGLYSLILSSKMPKAKAFKRWVTSEVLPSIRKRGIYATDEAIEQIIKNPDLVFDYLGIKKERQENRLATC